MSKDKKCNICGRIQIPGVHVCGHTGQTKQAPPVGAIAELQRRCDTFKEWLGHATTVLERQKEVLADMQKELEKLRARDGEVSENP